MVLGILMLCSNMVLGIDRNVSDPIGSHCPEDTEPAVYCLREFPAPLQSTLDRVLTIARSSGLGNDMRNELLLIS